ncbi:putative gCN5-like N-acetyltransferase [Serratia marcescens]|nr:putative gCN5-like N-acetyltransferase [Serratia marcescens]
MTPIVRTATLEDIHRLYQRIPEFGGLHSLADLQRRIGTAPPAC